MEFDESIYKFNQMYKLPLPELPTTAAVGDVKARMKGFMKTLSDELSEGADIVDKLEAGATEQEILTELADWLVDIQIYCASEMAKYGIPLALTQNIVMQSNFSKLGADGKPIYDEHGKVLKGPGYWHPEPRISEMLSNYRKD